MYDYFDNNDYPANFFLATRPAFQTYSTTALLLLRVATFSNETLVKSTDYDIKPEVLQMFFRAWAPGTRPSRGRMSGAKSMDGLQEVRKRRATDCSM